jgi:RNA polymerase sigma factor FliA
MAAATVALAKQANAAEPEMLLLEHLPPVQYVARRNHGRLPQQVLLVVLVHAGILGLMDAVRKIDPSKNVQLKHYAEFRIRGAILDSLRLVDWSPRALRRQARRREQAINQCKAGFGCDRNDTEIAEEMQVSLGSLQQDADEPGDREISHSRAEAAEYDPYHQTLRAETKHLLEKAIGKLPGREREVFALYHFQELAMKQVGAMTRIGESRVSQIHTSALLRLCERLAGTLSLPKAF